jgi:hypothetical protein
MVPIINLNRLAQELMYQYAYEVRVNIVFIMEPYRQQTYRFNDMSLWMNLFKGKQADGTTLVTKDTDMVCYADDTLVLAGGRGWYETQRLAETAVACAVCAIRRLGLNVSPTKSEALGFFDHRTRGAPPPKLCVDIDGEEVPVRSQMRYLGLTIDSGWTFGPHFDLLVPKVTAAANALCGLLLNIGGAGTGVRRLYEGVSRSRVLYGAPIWAGDLMANRRSLTLLRRLHRTT